MAQDEVMVKGGRGFSFTEDAMKKSMLNQKEVRDKTYDALEKSRQEFEAEMASRRAADKSRAIFTKHLPNDEPLVRVTHIEKMVKTKAPDVMKLSDRELASLIHDVIAICVGTDKSGWTSSYKDILNSLRGSRWKTYTLKGDRTWTINTEDESNFLQNLIQWGFDDAIQGPYTIYDRNKQRSEMNWEKVYLKPNNERLEAKRLLLPTPAATSNRQPLEVSLMEDVDEVLEALKGEKDQKKKRVLRAKLRRMGHRGGLRSIQE